MLYHNIFKLKDDIKIGDIIQGRYLIIDKRAQERYPYSVILSIFDLYTCKQTSILLNELDDFIMNRYKESYVVVVRSCQDIAYIEYV